MIHVDWRGKEKNIAIHELELLLLSARKSSSRPQHNWSGGVVARRRRRLAVHTWREGVAAAMVNEGELP